MLQISRRHPDIEDQSFKCKIIEKIVTIIESLLNLEKREYGFEIIQSQ
jgi:hypothetical protein